MISAILPAEVESLARPIQYLETSALEGDVTVEDTAEGHCAVVDGITLTVADDGTATVLLPAGRNLQIVAGSTGEEATWMAT